MYSKSAIDFAQKQYDAEIARKAELLQRAAIATGALSLSGSLFSYATLNYHPMPFAPWHVFFYLPFAAGVILSGFALFKLAGVFLQGAQYSYMPDAKAVLDFAAVDASASAAEAQQIEDDTLTHLTERYATCAGDNFAINQKRNDLLFDILKLTIGGLLCLLFSMVGFYFMRLQAPDSPAKIEITNPVKIQK